MLALFNTVDLIAQRHGQLVLDEPVDDVPAVVVGPVMPEGWELIPRHEIDNQGVLGA
ncbi:hypothetical protein [Actinocrispum wychmicini]|uniref:Uncharacterized protein n=1 Tax=Actinocrispum wychmicini TaxID=1213861 RepID=A0A4R2JLX2_9PSEU|nr:hypothetical protein [Actinocrispum wychmicini]TCO61083.1 hypothetical protein EV192_103667 [Actinocrispum wychmicini]